MQQYITTIITGKDLPEELNNLFQPVKKLYCKGNLDLLKSRLDLRRDLVISGSSREDDMELFSERGEPVGSSKEETTQGRLSGDSEIAEILRGSSLPRVGIVGARKFTPYGREVTSQIATKLARAGVTVVSGLALGVDSIAHKACLDAGGRTISVLPSSVNKIYPATHHHLAQDILAKNGLLVSEYASDDLPMKHQFIERNRIIAALSDVLIITEAAVNSGSLHTARFALEQGIDIMAVPGNITSPLSGGTNRLIQTGAIPILAPEDVLAHLGLDQSSNIEYLPESKEEQVIIEAIKDGKTSTNELIAALKLESSRAQTCLTMLEIKGILTVSGGHWSLNYSHSKTKPAF